MFKNKTKKLIILFVIVGLFVVFSSVFAQSFGINEVGNGLNNSLTTSDPRETAGRIINIILGMLGVIAVGIIMWGGFVWLTSNGEEEKIRKAQTILRNGAIGLVIILASWGIATFILSRLGGAINGGNGGSCTDGDTRGCGCELSGTMTCSNGSWGFCVNANTKCDEDNKPTSCDSSPNPLCQAANQICDPSDYCDSASCVCKPKGGPGDSCDGNLQNQVCDADNNLCGEYLSCNNDTCTCFGPPVITEISPVGGFCQDNPDKSCTKDFDCGTTCNLTTPNGAINNFITIYGKSFGTYSSSSKVIFEGSNNPREGKQPVELNSACVNTWKDNEIVIVVPSGAGSGPIKVINKDSLSDETNNDYGPKIDDFQVNGIVRPGLCSLDPSQGILSGKVNYQGFNLYSGNAYFGNYQSNVQGIVSNFSNPQGLSGNSFIPNIQPGNSGSFVVSNVGGNKQSSNSLSFTKEQETGAGPYIISFSPSEGTAGQYVTIRGNGFGSSKGTSSVYFGDTEASYDFPDICLNSVWKDNQIIVKVPAGLSDAYHVIKIKLASTTIDTSKINPNTFRSDKNLSLLTSICKIDPNNGPVATPVSLWGENFGSVNSEALIKFSSDKTATGTILKEGRADSVKTNVPSGAITGPVKVIKKDQFGNEINFTVGSCTVNADCGAAQICCPSGTYRQGRCFGSLESCSSDMPTSVFEWNFSTSFSGLNIDPYYSCAGMANNLGSCQVGTTCPNVPGTCSPYGGGKKIIGQDCDYSCVNIPGCSDLGANNCSYDSTLNKCVVSGAKGVCDLSQKFVYNLGGTDKEFTKTCNKDKHWEITTPGSCPSNWTRAAGNRCIDLVSNCSSCGTGLNCEDQGNNEGRCVSGLLCPDGATCEKNTDGSASGKCITKDEATCSCCCQIGKDDQSCCAGLTCAGTCGSDSTDDGAGLGSCSGCAAAGNTTAARDAACNCTGHSGQYCDINSAHPQGICSDCTGLSNKQNCDDHSAACCFDAKKTVSVLDDYCRGGEGIKSGVDQGYCAYFNCQDGNAGGDPKLCASTTPVKLGYFNTVDRCTSTSTGCFADPGADHCSLFSGDQGACLAENNCCFDKGDSKCKGSEKIAAGPDKGYCAYYNCQSGNNKLCNLIASTSGQFMSASTCATKCANEEGGAGLACAGVKPDDACVFSGCTFPGLKCLTSTGSLGLLPDCGTCCCQPGLAQDSCATALTPTLHCQADKGNCSGAGRGLCCGCATDTECGNAATTGCASDSCCQARPKIESVVPAHLSSAVCRNAVVSVSFNQLMNSSSANNVILLEEKTSGVCQSGYLAGTGNSVDDLFTTNIATKIAQVYKNFTSSIRKIISRFSGQVLADIPDSNKVYCIVSGNVRSEDSTNKSTLVFSPTKLLNPNSNYYLVVLGDENLNSQSGVISLNGIGFNGEGYFDQSRNLYVEGELIKFNNKVYKNSRITKFTTLSGENSICKIDHVVTSPDSYLFKTTANDLNEKDSLVADKSFDSVADRDKVFTAKAYSASGQVLQPVTNYFWDWSWKVENNGVAAISPVVNLEANRAFVYAKDGVVDDSTKLSATVDMNRFQTSCDSSMSCECKDSRCSSNCCNNYSTGDLISQSSNLYVFICQNPWPPVAANGSWSPWNDNCQGSMGGNCADYNYKFYYCRDTGDNTTLDDLPAIINQAVIRGQSTNLVCSSNNAVCSPLNSPCGADNDGNGVADGVCLWNILKESYFFREAGAQGGQVISSTDVFSGDSVRITWRSEAAQAASYKIYYSKSGQSSLLSKEVTPSSACSLIGSIYDCSTVISGLTNGVSYNFKVSVVSVNKVETLLLGELSATPTDKTPPSIPTGLKAEIKNNKLLFTWAANTDKANSYTLYHGTSHLNYGEFFYSNAKTNSIEFDVNKFDFGNHYFALTAVDLNGNESNKSSEINFVKNNCSASSSTCVVLILEKLLCKGVAYKLSL